MAPNWLFYRQISKSKRSAQRSLGFTLQCCTRVLVIVKHLTVLLTGKLRHTARDCEFVWRRTDLVLTIHSRLCLLERVVWTAAVGKSTLCSGGNGKQQILSETYLTKARHLMRRRVREES